MKTPVTARRPATDLDSADMRILRSLQRNNMRPHREVADEVGLSVAAVARRIQKLRDNKVIADDVSILDQDAVGRPLTLIVEVTTENERLDLLVPTFVNR